MSSSLLHMHGVAKHFGATRALHEVSLEVHAGEVTALIGENGAGKSTLMKTLSGVHRPDAGRMELRGQPFQPADPQQARAAGIAMIYQELNLAPDLSVEDNIMLGQEAGRWGWLRRSQQRPAVLEALKLLGHSELQPGQIVSRLSVGAQQLVEIARALVMDASLIVFDEPTSSLTRQDVEHLFAVIRRLKGQGLGIVYISHFLEEVRRICDRYTILRDGEVAGTGTVAEVSDEQMIGMMVGRSVDELFPSVPHEPGEPILSLESLSGGRPGPHRRMVRDVSMELRRGEILGIAGLVGAGRTELLRCLFGLDPVTGGRVKIAGLTPTASPQGRIAAGLGLVSEDRKGEGLAQGRSLADNMTYSRLSPYSRFGWLNLRRRSEAVRTWMQRLSIRARSEDQPVLQLSGGNQQKVALARVLHQQADVLLLDEPTRGVDVGTKAEIYRLMGEWAVQGKAVIFVSSYFTELLEICDRVAVMERGRLREIRPADEWTEESILQCAVGI